MLETNLLLLVAERDPVRAERLKNQSQAGMLDHIWDHYANCPKPNQYGMADIGYLSLMIQKKEPMSIAHFERHRHEDASKSV